MAVYTAVTAAQADALLSGYDIGPCLALEGIAQGVENSNYLLTTPVGRHILTLLERRVTAEELPFFVALMGHLAAAGLPVPRPVADRGGEALQRVAGRPALIVTFLPGDWPRRPGPAETRAVGSMMAQLHRAAADLPMRRANRLGPDAWGPLLEACGGAAEVQFPGLPAQLEAGLRRILDAWPRGLPQGVIHADLFPDNVFFTGREPSGVIDFYFACNDGLAYDLAIAVNAWAFDGANRFDPDIARALIAGYGDVRPLTAAERAGLPILCAGASLRFSLTRLYDWLNRPADALGIAKDPLECAGRMSFFLDRASAGLDLGRIEAAAT